MIRRRLGRSGRAWWWGLGLLVVGGLGLLMSVASPAGAAPPSPEPSPSFEVKPPPALDKPWPSEVTPHDDPSSPPPSASQEPPAEKAEEKPKEPTAADKRKALEKEVSEYKKRFGSKGGVLGAFETTDEYGIPLSAYQVATDSGGWTEWDLKMQSFLVQGAFTGTKWVLAVGCWLMLWALSWSLAGILFKPALAVATALRTHVVLELGVPALMLAFSGTLAVWHLFFGDRSRGWGEIAASLLVSALSVTTLASPPTLLLSHEDGAVGKARALGLEVAAIVLDHQEAATGADASTLTRPITDAMVHAFVVQPAMLLSYDQAFTGQCAEMYSKSRVRQAVFDQKVDQVTKKIKKAPSSWKLIPVIGEKIDETIKKKAVDAAVDQFADQPAEDFEDECVKGDVGAAKKVSWDKVGGAVFVLLAAVLVFSLLVALAFSYMIAQAWAAFEAMIAPVALAAGIAPGPGRAFLWSRAMSVLRILGLLVALVVALAAFIVVIVEVLGADAKEIPGGLIVRFVVVDVLCVAALIFRRRLVRSSQRLAGDMRTRLGNTRLGGRSAATDAGARPRRSALATVARTGLVLGTLAASGGTSSAALAAGRAGGARSLTYRLARTATGRAGRRVARQHAGGAVGRLPARFARAGTGAPARAGQPVGVHGLRQRLADASTRRAAPGPRPAAPQRWAGGAPGVPGWGGTGPAGPPAAAPPGMPGGEPRPRPRRPAPVRMAHAQPGSARQAALQNRLHRLRQQRIAPGPRTPTRPVVSPSRRAGRLRSLDGDGEGETE